MTITRQELQAELSSRFPVEIDKHVAIVRLSNPVVAFPAGRDRVALRLDLAADSALGGTTGNFRAEGRVEYVESEHAFYLREPEITELHVNVPDSGRVVGTLVNRACGHVNPGLVEPMARAAVEEALRRQPIYRLDENRNEREAKAIRHLRSVRVENDALLLEVGLKR